MAKPGVKPKQIPMDVVEGLAALYCTIEEIAMVVGCSRDTIERRVRAEIKAGRGCPIQRGRAKGRQSLRMAQYQAAKAGDRTMLVWLGKQWLGQSDRAPDEAPIRVEVATPAAAPSLAQVLGNPALADAVVDVAEKIAQARDAAEAAAAAPGAP